MGEPRARRGLRYRAAMLFPQRFWDGLADGSVTLAFRRWRRRGVKAGGTQLTPPGLLAIDAVDVVTEEDITGADARRAGYADRAELLAELDRHPDGTLYRIAFHRAGDDPRLALRATLDREPQPFKVDVRKLKSLGLTESLEAGYRLSPRGRTVLERP